MKQQIDLIADGAGGDARKALTMLESIVYSSDIEDDNIYR